MDRLEELRQKYYESIMLLQDEADIENALPKPEYENFFPLIKGIINMLKEELQRTQQLNQDDLEMKEYIEEEIRLIKLKLDICNRLLHKAQEDKTTEDDITKTPKKNIIFATTDSGNVCIEHDLKDIPEEYLQYIEEGLIQLQQGFKETKVEKGREMVNNSKISKVHEIKFFKVRLFYKILSSDTVYMLMVRMKKSDNDLRDVNEITERVKQRNNQYESLKRKIKDPKTKEELIKQNEEILNRILGHIDQKKR